MTPVASDCIAAVIQVTGCPPEWLADPSIRAGQACAVRRLAALVMRREAKMSYQRIAAALNMLSHASVHRAINHPNPGKLFASITPHQIEYASVLAVRAARKRMPPKNPHETPPVPVRYIAAVQAIIDRRHDDVRHDENRRAG